MNRKSIIAGLAGALGIAGLAFSGPATAAEAVPVGIARGLDAQAVEFTMTAAKERRLMIIQNTNRNLAGRRGYGHRPGYGPRPGYGRGYGRRDGYRRGYGY